MVMPTSKKRASRAPLVCVDFACREARPKLHAVATRRDLSKWVEDALRRRGGSATIAQVCKEVWKAHEHDLRTNEQLLYTWQYDIRWAATRLRHKGRIRAAGDSPRGVWELTSYGRDE